MVFEDTKTYLDQDSLVQLRSYKYQSVDKSYLSYYILNPYWTWCAKFMPSWLAPNVITLLGIIAIYANVITILIYIPDLVGPGPSWIYYSFAAGIFFYQTMDNIDGKQARATGTSSPLGELFDHGIDSLNCCLGGLVQSACMGMGSSKNTAIVTFITCVAMYLSTWETYHTHVLYLGYLNGPTEGIIIAVIMMLISGAYGIQVWNNPISSVFSAPMQTLFSLFMGGSPYQVGQLPLKDLWVAFVFWGVLIGHVPVCLYNVYQYKRANKESFTATLPNLIPIVIASLSVYLWLWSPYSIILSDNHIVLFTLAMSLVFGRMTTTIILAHLTRQPFPYWSTPMTPLVIGAGLFRFFRWPSSATVIVDGVATASSSSNANKLFSYAAGKGAAMRLLARTISGPNNIKLEKLGSPETADLPLGQQTNYSFPINFELLYLWLFFAYLVLYFSVYARRVIKGITEFLGISAFTVKKPADLNKAM
ncbi:uncharacterized protein SAPINGB_P002363 [Magnusiomyces paraingens]|uniref:Uncharacterized protein n=1 Tax=Magnusiomyces paraingens TaxID=2606893 RepID=A0A5E8BJC9_9ASCO|nr:uncharacterized protein SAPINGB_P002363 [Saprochaete ingens]VVT49627.1 unnamed protein product [Saprochaete ingens]